LLYKELAGSRFSVFFKIRSIGLLSFCAGAKSRSDAMPKSPKPFVVTKRTDSKTFRLTINPTSGLPGRVCAEWRRRSFQDLPDELSPYHAPRTKSAAEAGTVALIACLKNRQGKKPPPCPVTVKDFAKDMFTEGAPRLARWAAKGKILKRQTVAQHRRHLAGYLLPKFGHLWFSEITPTLVEDFLLEQRLSNSCRNTVLYTL
jgi:hypothetical protein